MLAEHLGDISPEMLIESIGSAVLVFDACGVVQAWNSHAAEVLALQVGLSPREAQRALGGGVADLVSACLANGARVRLEQTEIPVEGSARVFGFTASPIHAGGRLMGVVLTGRDITEKIEIEKTLEELRRKADFEAVIRKVVHQLRNPLHIIRGYAQYMTLTSKPADSYRSYAEVVVSETDRLDRTLEGLREFSQARRLEVQVSSPEPAVREASRVARGFCEEADVAFEEAIGGELLPIPHDPERLQEVFAHLLRNAAEATGRGGRVLLRAQTLLEGTLRVDVEDDGPGPDPAVAGRLFELFETTKTEKGCGVGLAVSREIVEGHGGSIRHEPLGRSGTRFRVEIPRP